MKKLVFRFNNVKSSNTLNNKDILGGKGANLAQMAKLGLPVPPGFTISTKICDYLDFTRQIRKLWNTLKIQVH